MTPVAPAVPAPPFDALGTSEARWLRSGALHDLPRWQPAPVRSVVIVAPHPDDEVLGAGGLARQMADRGVPIDLVAVTDGEASHPHSPHARPADLARWRASERRRALHRLGVTVRYATHLHLADGGVAPGEDQLAAAVAAVAGPDTLLLAPWAHDGHPDHDATGRAARRAAAHTGCRLAEYLVWAWHWSAPGDGAIPLGAAVRVDLHQRQRAAKRWATAAYRSQVRPLGPGRDSAAILPPPVLRRAWRSFEVLLPWPVDG